MGMLTDIATAGGASGLGLWGKKRGTTDTDPTTGQGGSDEPDNATQGKKRSGALGVAEDMFDAFSRRKRSNGKSRD